MIISLGVILVPIECVKLSNIVISLFTAFLVAFVISILGYFHEKKDVLISAYVFLSEVYLRLSKSKKKTSDILLKTSDIKNHKNILEDIYVQLDGISKSKYNRIIEFHGFYKKSKTRKCLAEVLSLTNSVNTLISKVSEIKQIVIQYEMFKIDNITNHLIFKTDSDYQNNIKDEISNIHEIEKNIA